MYTQCPECLSVLSLDVRTFAQAHGHIVCGHCGAGFDSVATLTDQLPPEPFVELPVNEPAMEPPCVDLVVYRPQPDPPAVVPAEPAARTPASDEEFSQLVFAPRFARESGGHKHARSRPRRQPRRPRESSGERSWPWLIACVVLGLTLLAQLGWAERNPIIRNPEVGGWLRGACATLGCRLPLVSAPAQLRLVASNVQAHPSVTGALMISASVRNDAAFTQPYPVLTITLIDARGRRVAMRRLKPAEYLDDEMILRRGLAPGANAVLVLEVEDPGSKAVAFEFGFE